MMRCTVEISLALPIGRRNQLGSPSTKVRVGFGAGKTSDDDKGDKGLGEGITVLAGGEFPG